MTLFAQFLLRLAFGLSFGMAITSPRLVSSGFFRNNLYVMLGLSTLAAMVSYSAAPSGFWYAVGAIVTSYIGVVLWLYEKPLAGKAAILLVAFFSIAAMYSMVIDPARHEGEVALMEPPPSPQQRELSEAELAQMDERKQNRIWADVKSDASHFLSDISSGLLLGLITTAMLLGHWYLNSPSMELAPLRRLIAAASGAVALQALLSLLGLAGEYNYAADITTQRLLFLVLRWSFGIVGVAVLLWMAWQTLKVPNTQSATGILFVAVIASFVGELTGLLLSADSAFPL
jgi:hypothetical protein